MAAFFYMSSLFIDLLSIGSIVGIWPRFIEPRLLRSSELNWELPPNAAHLAGLRIVHLTDLHFHEKIPQRFLDKVIRQVCKLKPDLILFTGDFLCYSHLDESGRLAAFLCRLEAPLGSYCTFGNHDYAQYVSLNRKGVYDLLSPPNPLTGIFRGLRTLCSPQRSGIQISEKVLSISLHETLCTILRSTPFKLLENATVTLPIGLNLSGLGDLALGRCRPQTAFAGYNPQFPGIVLSHNPDSFPALLDFPGDWILCGHTHGEQIHIPWPKWGRSLSQKLARLENRRYTRGLFTVGGKKLYVNRGLGCHKPFRLFSPPEICLIKAIAP
jgi:uncharacterized protein